MISADDIATSRKSFILANMPENVADELLAQARIANFERGENVFLQGDPADQVCIVLDGWVKLFRMTQKGSEAVVGIFTRGGSFGEGAALGGGDYPVSAEAVTGTRLLQIRSSSMLELMKSHPELCLAMLASTFKHLHSLVRQIEQLKAQSGAQRVAEFLLDLGPVEHGACTVTLPYDKSLIAGRLGMTPESLSRAFARLREVGVDVVQNHAVIDDIPSLRDFAEMGRA